MTGRLDWGRGGGCDGHVGWVAPGQERRSRGPVRWVVNGPGWLSAAGLGEPACCALPMGMTGRLGTPLPGRLAWYSLPFALVLSVDMSC